MEQLNYNTKERKFKHLIYGKRQQIEALSKANKKPKEIAEIIGCCKRTIERELKRGKVKQRRAKYDYYGDIMVYSEYTIYSAEIAQADYEIKSTAKGVPLKIGNDFKLLEYIENCIGKEKLSPYSTAERIKASGKFNKILHWKTIYNYLDKDIFLNISNKDLWEKSRRKKRKYRKTRIAYNNSKGTSITERPIEAEDRQVAGHWEMDTVESGKGARAALLVLTERASRTEEIYKLKGKKQEEVKKALDKIERKIGAKAFRKRYKTITCDNGSEFLAMDELEKSVVNRKKRTKIYFCHPYSAYERGSNENANRMIRRFIPKGTNIANYSEEEIQKIQDYINNCPRLILGGYPPKIVLERLTA